MDHSYWYCWWSIVVDPIILYVERRDRREIYGKSIEYDEFLIFNRWPFQDPIDWRYLPYIFGLFFRPKFQGISPQNMAKNMVRTYLHFRILKISHWSMNCPWKSQDEKFWALPLPVVPLTSWFLAARPLTSVSSLIYYHTPKRSWII